MESKYYTPDEREFYIGFEFESYVDRFDEWRKNVVGRYEWPAISSLGNYCRVKHLDRKDIESLGFVYEGYDKDGKTYNYYTHKNGLTLHTYEYAEIDDIIEEVLIYKTQRTNTKFQGTIKNKSELKQLLKQLNQYE